MQRSKSRQKALLILKNKQKHDALISLSQSQLVLDKIELQLKELKQKMHLSNLKEPIAKKLAVCAQDLDMHYLFQNELSIKIKEINILERKIRATQVTKKTETNALRTKLTIITKLINHFEDSWKKQSQI